MAIGVLILGESGTGKTYSIKGFKPEEVKILSVKKPILPFRGEYELVKTPTGADIKRELKNTKKKAIVIDDFQYVLGVQMMKRVAEKGWDKFNEIQQPYADVLEAIDELPDDVIVYLNSHIEIDENGKKKIKTIGKALDKYLTVEGLFMIVLGTLVVDGKYFLTTQNSGSDTIKSPENMFPSYAIDNNLKYIDEKIRNYYHIGEFLTDDEIAEIDEAVKHDEIPIKEEPKKRGKRGAKKEEPENTSSKEESEEAETEAKPKRSRRKVSDELAEEREEVKAKNEEIIVYANTSESGEPIPFEEAKEPELESLPKRKSRKKSDDKVQADSEPTAADESNEPSEKPKRSRTRRTSKEEPTETVEPSGAETTSEAPTRRRRRRA